MEITGYDIDFNMFKSTCLADDIPSGKIMLTYQDIKNGIIRPYLKMPEGSYYYHNNFIYRKVSCDSILDFDAIDLTTGYLCALNKRGIKVHEFKGKIKVKNKIGEKDFKEILDEGVDKFPVEVENEYGVKVNRVDIRVIGYTYFDRITESYLSNKWFGFRFDSVLFRPNKDIICDNPDLSRSFFAYDCFRPKPYEDYEPWSLLNRHGFSKYQGLGYEVNRDLSHGHFRYDLGIIPAEEEIWIEGAKH